MSTVQETTIRVPTALRDQIRAQAAARHVKQADLLTAALRELEQAEFLRAVAQTAWDESNPEDQSWDRADLSTPMDMWEPTS
ncbi:MAG: hypothetical protein LBG99_06455 [Propionibacteriaceae bacterium]|nr:hypothetical protein [Propionibacteriaceae bacterium]